MSLRRLSLALLLPALLFGEAAPLAAQSVCDRRADPVCPEASRNPRWRGEAVTVGVNAVIGGLTAGLMRQARGGSFRQGFVAGAAGGAATYAGKRISAERWDGAGLLGRQVGALGSSVSRNAAEGRGALDRVVLPLGPVRLYVSPREESPVRAKVDLAAVVVAGAVALQPETSFDAGASLSSGALVFRRYGDEQEVGWNGTQAAGVVTVRAGFDRSYDEDPRVRERVRGTLAHERVHVAQYDQAFLLWSAPAEEWAMGGAPWSRGLHRYVDLSLNAALFAGLNSVWSYESRPWEEEAFFLSRTRPEDRAQEEGL